MSWDLEGFVDRFVADFVLRALPDARDWGGGLRVVPTDEGWSVEVDVPTSTLDCWLDFDVVDGDQGPVASNLHALRSGTGADGGSVYSWDERKGSWQLSSGGEGGMGFDGGHSGM